MGESASPEGEEVLEDLVAEFRTLGSNLKNLLRSAWQSPEGVRLQREIEDGLSAVITALNQAASDFRESPEGQRLRQEVQELHARLKSGELEKNVRTQLFSILRRINEEIAKASCHETNVNEQDR